MASSASAAEMEPPRWGELDVQAILRKACELAMNGSVSEAQSLVNLAKDMKALAKMDEQPAKSEERTAKGKELVVEAVQRSKVPPVRVLSESSVEGSGSVGLTELSGADKNLSDERPADNEDPSVDERLANKSNRITSLELLAVEAARNRGGAFEIAAFKRDDAEEQETLLSPVEEQPGSSHVTFQDFVERFECGGKSRYLGTKTDTETSCNEDTTPTIIITMNDKMAPSGNLPLRWDVLDHG